MEFGILDLKPIRISLNWDPDIVQIDLGRYNRRYLSISKLHLDLDAGFPSSACGVDDASSYRVSSPFGIGMLERLAEFHLSPGQGFMRTRPECVPIIIPIHINQNWLYVIFIGEMEFYIHLHVCMSDGQVQ